MFIYTISYSNSETHDLDTYTYKSLEEFREAFRDEYYDWECDEDEEGYEEELAKVNNMTFAEMATYIEKSGDPQFSKYEVYSEEFATYILAWGVTYERDISIYTATTLQALITKLNTYTDSFEFNNCYSLEDIEKYILDNFEYSVVGILKV